MSAPMRCDCGDSECPSCGEAQGTRAPTDMPVRVHLCPGGGFFDPGTGEVWEQLADLPEGAEIQTAPYAVTTLDGAWDVARRLANAEARFTTDTSNILAEVVALRARAEELEREVSRHPSARRAGFLRQLLERFALDYPQAAFSGQKGKTARFPMGGGTVTVSTRTRGRHLELDGLTLEDREQHVRALVEWARKEAEAAEAREEPLKESLWRQPEPEPELAAIKRYVGKTGKAPPGMVWMAARETVKTSFIPAAKSPPESIRILPAEPGEEE